MESSLSNNLEHHGLSLLHDRESVLAGIDQLADKIVAAYAAYEVINLVPVITGGMQFGAALLTALEKRSPGKWIVAPVFAAAYLNDQVISEPAIEFPGTFDARINEGVPVLIVDDLLDSGTTINELIRQILAKGIPAVQLAVLLERNVPRTVDVRPDFCVFELQSDAWVVGFGMDSEQRFRGLDAIYLLQK